MSVLPLRDDQQTMPALSGHAIGFVDTQDQCDAVTAALATSGFPESTIAVLNGEDGISLLKRMIKGATWGEEAEAVLEEGVKELRHGYFALIIETSDRDEAVRAAIIASEHGGHSFSHFGLLTDERLTM